MENFRTFFEQNYQGTEAFISEIIEPVFGTAFNKADENLLKSFPTLKPAAERANIISINRFGTCDLDVPMEFFDITLNDHVHLSQSRVYIQQLVRQIMQTYSAALIIFHYTDNELEWRVSYVSKGSSAADATSAKRYTYLMGRNQKCRTAAERFAILAGKEKNETTITDAFSVETLTKQFYNELFAWYQWALSDDKGFAVTYPNDTNTDTDDRRIDEHIIRLITRLMFVWFIKQKKLVPEKIFKTDELKNILTAFDPTSNDSGNYYNAILQNLFFATLNKPIHEREFATEINYQGKDEHYGIKTLFRDAKEGSWFKKSKNEIIDLFKEVPFLNGGLFECLDKENADGKIYYYDGFSRKAGRQKRAFLPNCLFFDPEKGIIPLLEKYNFTVEENTSSDVEVALDPELLGKVFENLLGAFNPETKETARKQSGSFYTPREIVNYMVDESLTAYLTTVCSELDEASIRLLFNQDELAEELAQSSEKRNKLATAIRSAKMLDPACGSGAFPMGMLNRMLDILQKLSTVAVHVETPCLASLQYETKLHLIENCIYGIDIQTIAVQITKLRFFISLVCEQTPTDNANDNYGILALPNLETKFVAANTLIGLKKDFSDKLDLQNDELKVLKNQLLDIRHKHFSAPNVNEKHKLRKQDAELRKDIKAYLIESSTKPNAYKIELLKNQLLELKSQKKQYEDEKWEDTTLKPKQQVALDFGFDTLPETQPTIFLIDVNKQKRDEIDALIKQTENEIIREESKTHIDGFEDEAEKLAHWNPYDQNTSSPFFDPEWMFGIKEGFDVVIGNPPYHQLSKDASATDDYKLYLKNRFNTSGGRLNTFIFFTHLGVQILKQNGVISYIIPNTILSQDYYKETRKYLLDETIIKKIVSYDHLPFENAVVENITFVCVKNKIENNLIYHYVDNFRTIISDFVKQKADFYKTDTYTFNFKSNELTDKIAENSINLGSICLINQAIALKGDKSLSLRSENSDFKYYRLLDGRNINRYSINWSGVYLDYDVNRIHSCKNKLIFLTDEKLLFRRVSAKLVFAYDNEQYFALNTIVVVNLIDKDTFNLKYLLSILNSKLIDYYYFNKHKSTKTVFSEIQARSVSELPIKYSNKQALFITLVDQILSFKKENPQSDTTILEQQIDNLVYKLYDLTYEEVKVVDPAFALTEEEYYSIEIA